MQSAAEPLKSPLLQHFNKFPSVISVSDQERLRKAATEAYMTAYQPGWKRLRDTIVTKYLPKTRATFGLSAMSGGSDLYAIAVRNHTTTNYSPEQIHKIGLNEVERIRREMAEIRKEVHFTGTGEEFVTKVLEAPGMLFTSEAEILSHGRDIAKRLDPELPRLFKVLPRTPYGVKAIPPDRARTAAPYYEPPSIDGTRAGNFFLRTYQPEKQSKCCMEALIIHEAVPGHHLQVALARELEGMPEFRKITFFTAFIEGWGMYAETLGPELGMYQSPYERYGKLQTEIMRAVRLVVDTGIHTLDWPREKAIEMMKLAKGGFITDELIASEVDRYITWPGQALAYKVGGLKMQELRARAEKELGSRFDIREFHHVVLRNGALPLDILEEQVNEYVSRIRK
jgi:prolyl oligopeptidase